MEKDNIIFATRKRNDSKLDKNLRSPKFVQEIIKTVNNTKYESDFNVEPKRQKLQQQNKLKINSKKTPSRTSK